MNNEIDVAAKDEHAAKLFHQMDTIFHQRVNITLLSQSIFLLAAARLWEDTFVVSVVSMLGIVTLLIFAFANAKLYFRITWILKRLMGEGGLYENYIHMTDLTHKQTGFGTSWLLKVTTQNRMPQELSTGWLYSFAIPTLMLLGWFSLLIYRWFFWQ